MPKGGTLLKLLGPALVVDKSPYHSLGSESELDEQPGHEGIERRDPTGSPYRHGTLKPRMVLGKQVETEHREEKDVPEDEPASICF